jgi:hypothetical protein
MNQKTTLTILAIVLAMPFILATGNISNLQISQDISDFVAGETMTTIFSFDYPDSSTSYPDQEPDSPLVIVANISSNDSNYPVWENDFRLDGSLTISKWGHPDEEHNFDCTEDEFTIKYKFGEVEIPGTPGIFYCSDDDLLTMDLESNNEIELDIKSHPALFPGKYNISLGLFYPEKNQTFYEFNLTVYSPLEKKYDTKKTFFNITTSREVYKIEYIDWNYKRPRWKTLCRKCDEYGFSKKKTKNLYEGYNNLTIRARDEYGNNTTQNVTLFIDSKEPRISKTEPKRNKFTNGKNFYIKFKEDNPTNITLFINNSFFHQVNISDCVQSRSYKECYFDLNLTKFNSQEVEYFFVVEDIVGNIDFSRITKVKVDTEKPKIDYFNFTQDERKIYFTFNITEQNFDEITYTYLDYKNRSKEKRLCSRLKNDQCIKRKSFRSGVYNLTINVLDDAGNFEQTKADFIV